MIAEKKQKEQQEQKSKSTDTSTSDKDVDNPIDDEDDDPTEEKVGTVGNGAPLVGMAFKPQSDFENDLDQIAATQGRKKALEQLREAVAMGAVSLSYSDYMKLMNKYIG